MADDLNRLLLSASRFPGVDMPFAVEQIASRRQIKDKLPSWYANDALVFPAKIATEQCSSERTALYKQQLIEKDIHLCDLTGGLGIDSYYFSLKAKRVTYIERFENYCKAASHNFECLGAENIQVVEGDASVLFPNIPVVDVWFIDPARRGDGNKRVFALKDCEPDLPVLLPLLLQYAPKVIAKLSPMADISQTLSLLPGTTEVHVVSVRNEAKELLFSIENQKKEDTPVIHCYNYTSEGKEERFSFTLEEEKKETECLSDTVLSYLYEPNASILKAGAFKSICRLDISKLHTHSHLYTSEQLLDSFPGRKFIVQEVLPFSAGLCKTLGNTIPQANITTRNFPLSVNELRQRTKIKEGGDTYLFATTLKNKQKTIVVCKRVTIN